MEETIIEKSLRLNREFIEKLSKEELNDYMKEFDNYEIREAMTPKEQAIKEAYGAHWELNKENIDTEGSFNCGYCLNGQEDAEQTLIDYGLDYKEGLFECDSELGNGWIYWKPKSLYSIEDNNGWVKIESESDLPTTEGSYFVYSKVNWGIGCRIDIFTGRLSNTIDHETGKPIFSHYQPIIKPKPPVY